MPGVHGGDAVTAHPLHQPLLRIVGVDGAKIRLQRGRTLDLLLIVSLIEVTRQPHDCVCIDQTGRDDLGLQKSISRLES